MDGRTAEEVPKKKEQRRAARFPVVVFVEAKWQSPSGESLKETAQAIEVSASGGVLGMKTYPSVATHLELTNLLSGEVAQARLVGTRRPDGPGLKVAVELLVPTETFWGVNFQLRKTSAELVKIEQAMQTGGVDPRILQDFRDSVDYVRKTAWAVQEWHERELQKHDPQTLHPLITSERIRRATQLNKAITSDVAAHKITRETAGIDEFFPAVKSLYQSVADLFREP